MKYVVADLSGFSFPYGAYVATSIGGPEGTIGTYLIRHAQDLCLASADIAGQLKGDRIDPSGLVRMTRTGDTTFELRLTGTVRGRKRFHFFSLVKVPVASGDRLKIFSGSNDKK